jgi:hypothetical protein
VFDSHLRRQLNGKDSFELVEQALRPLAGLSLASVVVRTAERVAAAGRHLHPCEIDALQVVSKILVSSADRARAAPVSSERKFGLGRILSHSIEEKVLFLLVLVAIFAVISMFLS